MTLEVMHWIMITGYLQPILHKQLGTSIIYLRMYTTNINTHYVDRYIVS